MTISLSDISSRDDVVRLVDSFYDRVRGDDLIGPIFNEVAHVDWGTHLPKMYDFWESVLFGSTGFKGNPLGVHLALSRRTALTSHEFDRWMSLFQATVDDLFSGATASSAKLRAARIAVTMQNHIADQACQPDMTLRGV